jgi:hypothetical protein
VKFKLLHGSGAYGTKAKRFEQAIIDVVCRVIEGVERPTIHIIDKVKPTFAMTDISSSKYAQMQCKLQSPKDDEERKLNFETQSRAILNSERRDGHIRKINGRQVEVYFLPNCREYL